MNLIGIVFFFLSMSMPALASGPNFNDTTQLPFSAGNTGIGTITPQGSLVVTNGNVGIATWAPADILQVGKYGANSNGFEVDANGNVGIETTNTSNAALTVPSGNVGIGTSSTSALLQLGAGSSSVAPWALSAGANLTTAAAGALEYDGTAPYFSVAASSRGVVPAVQFITQTSPYTLTSQTAAQQLFNSTTHGAITVQGSTSYFFDCFFSLTSMSNSSGTFGFAFSGTATLTSQSWESFAYEAASFTTMSPPNIHYQTAASTVLYPATASAPNGSAHIFGIIRVNAGGTLVPEVSLTVAAPAIVGADSYFMIYPIGSGTVQSQGNWS